ncbi:MAG: hypothetical protein A2189_06910, partial [Paenibacillus sp. RIFOXYA1_FULL_44_5]
MDQRTANEQISEQQTTRTTNPWTFSTTVGFFAGLIWGGIKLTEYGLHFTRVSPGFLVKPFFEPWFFVSWPGLFISWGVFIVFSICAALLYALFFRKVKGAWFSMVYGILWWLLLYAALGPMLG